MSLAAGSVTVMAADDVSQRTIVPMNFVSVVAVVTVLRPQSAPLSRRRSSAPRSRSSRIFRNGGSSSSASSCLRPSGAVRDASTAASVTNWSSATAPNARQRFAPSRGGARRCARSGRTSIAGRSALRQVGAGAGYRFFVLVGQPRSPPSRGSSLGIGFSR